MSHKLAALVLLSQTHVFFLEDGQILAGVLPVDHGGVVFVRGTRIPFEGGRWQLERAETGYG